MPKGTKRKSSNVYPKLSTYITTSTPIRRENFESDSFDILKNATPSSTCTQHSSISVDELATSTISLSSILNDYDDEEEGRTRKHVANVGKDWSRFQPQDASSIYRLILQQTGPVQDLAYKWFSLWEKHPEDGILFMFQFFLDVAGYQNYNIAKVYGTNKFNEKNLEIEFEKNYPKKSMGYTYLLRSHSEWANDCKAKIYDFIQELVICSNKRQGHNHVMLRELFHFLKLMSRSKIRSIRHTAVVFAAKLIVPISKLSSKGNPEENTPTKVVAAIDIQHQKNCTILGELQTTLFSIILNNYACQDPQLKEMRQDCVKCLHQALHWKPATFFKLNVVDMFTKLLLDSSAEVRLTVIHIFKKLMKSTKNYPYLKRRASNIFEKIFARRLEEDYSIAIAAIDFLTESLDLYRKDIPKIILNKIFVMVYNKYYPLGSAAGRFICAFISESQDSERIKAIIKLSNVQHLLPLLIESLIDCAQELQSYDDMLDLLLNSDLRVEDKVKLLQILCHSIIQNVAGKATVVRINPRKGKIENHKIEKATASVFPRIGNLFNMFSENTHCVNSILEMLLCFSFQDEFTVQYRLDIIQILKKFGRHFLNSSTSNTLDLISKLFSKVCDNYSPLETSGLSIYNNIFEQCEEMFNNFFSKDKNLQETENIRQLENILLRLQSIFKYHVTPMAWATENVENLFPKITKSNENVLRYNLLCSLAYEKRSFETTLQQMQPAADNFELKLKQLKQECDEFLDICYKYLKADTSNILMETAYECICDFTITIANEIYAKGEMYVNLLQQKTISEAHKTALLEFLRKFAFSNLVPESRALKYFSNICKAIMERGLPFSLLPNILMYYNSHYERYGKIFDQILKDIDKLDTNVLGIVVSSTLFLEYRDVMSKNTNRDFTYLKKMELQFTRILSAQSLVSVLRFAIDAGFTEEMNLPFLHYLIHLCLNLPANSKAFLLNYMFDNVNYNKFRGDTYVIEFANFLRNNKRKRITTPRGRPSKLLSSRSVTDLSSELGSTLDLSKD